MNNLHLTVIRFLVLSTLIAISSLFLSCSSTPEAKIVQDTTILPNRMDSIVWPKSIVIQPKLVKASKVVRPISEVRLGPGVQFPLQSLSLAKGQMVLILDRYRQWIKIFQPESHQEGWVHRKTVLAYNPKKPIKVPTKKLTSVFVVKPLAHLLDYHSKKKLAVPLKRGQLMKALLKTKRFVLVYIPQTNSVAWIKGGDIR